jgi:transposase
MGLYVDPPAHAVLLSIDEKSQIQAFDRTQPGLPIKKGWAGTMTHDYIRHGTTTLFAALNVLTGIVIGRNMQRHRHQEFIRFLNRVEAAMLDSMTVHAVVDNYATHKHPKVHAWLVRHPRWTFHFTSTSTSWLNSVEGFCSALTQRRLKRGVFCSLVDLQAAVNRYVAEHNSITNTQSPSPGPPIKIGLVHWGSVSRRNREPRGGRERKKPHDLGLRSWGFANPPRGRILG